MVLTKPQKRKGRQEIADKRPDTQYSPPSRITGTVILSRGKERRPDYHHYKLSYERLVNAYERQEARFNLNVEEAWDKYIYDDDFTNLGSGKRFWFFIVGKCKRYCCIKSVIIELLYGDIASNAITLNDLKAGLGDEYIYPFKHIQENYNHVWNGNPSKKEAYDYGYFSGKALQTLVSIGTLGGALTAKLASKAPKLAKLLKGTKGTGNSLVKDTGSVSKNTTNLRDWAKNKGWEQQNTAGGVEQWGVRNADGTFSWRLKLKPEASAREGLGAGSNQPRFDARLDDKGTYINPFTGETGGRGVGTHIPLGK
ncbi:hypothetical protein [Paenibacillus sp. PL2-23]|uniref:hypothetical protein n=1 Tax=Paenibacillus sp. PL2-23 TaxID=2100729 RepID=UPI0030FCDB0C